MRGSLILASLLAAAATARVLPRQESIEATYDEACNIGYCSIMGATVGGWGGNYTAVTTLEQFTAAVAGSETAIILLNATISGNNTQVTIGSNKSILGLPGSSLTGISLSLPASRNIILRNLLFLSPPPTTATISLSSARSIWIDHCDLSSSASPSSPPSLLSITHGSDYITVSHNSLHNTVSTAVSVGRSDVNAVEDKGKLHVTFVGNYFKGVSTAVEYRFGTGHLFNSLYEGVQRGVNTLMGAEVLVESSVFDGAKDAVLSTSESEGSGSGGTGRATLVDVVLGGAGSTAPKGEMNAESVPYPYDWYVLPSDAVRESVERGSGARLHYIEPIKWGEEEIAEREGRVPPWVSGGGHDHP